MTPKKPVEPADDDGWDDEYEEGIPEIDEATGALISRILWRTEGE